MALNKFSSELGRVKRASGARTMTITKQILKDIFFGELEIDNVHKDYSDDPGGGDFLLRFESEGLKRPLLQIKKKELPGYIKDAVSIDGLGLMLDERGDMYLICKVPRHF